MYWAIALPYFCLFLLPNKMKMMLILWFHHAIEIFFPPAEKGFIFPFAITVAQVHYFPGDLENRVSVFLLHPSLGLLTKGSRFSENPK